MEEEIKKKHEWEQSNWGKYLTCKVCGVVKSKEKPEKECRGQVFLRKTEQANRAKEALEAEVK